MIKENIEQVKHAVAKLEISADKKQVLQAMLSEIRTELRQLEEESREARMRQEVYSEVCDKMIAKLTHKLLDD